MKDYPSNSYKKRGIMKHFPVPSYDEFANEDGYYFVRLKYSVWHEIYGRELPFHFPNMDSALRFAKNNVSSVIVCARVFTPSGYLITTFDYMSHGISQSDNLVNY